VPEDTDGLLPWSEAEERLKEARNYWISTVRPDGRPHAMPIWAVWLDGRLYFEGSPQTRRMRNIAANPAVVIHLENGSQVVIIEGEAYAAGKPDHDLAARLSQDFSAKYAELGYAPGPENWDGGGLYIMKPKTGFAWNQFPKDTTRWRFRAR
jgi:nitroimidazol reductase NimA-like FMN-containing flavoprotein (pyridoxamine 5'-phosphate oxidase superfamily)